MVATNSLTRAAVLLVAAAAQVSALGSAIIKNQCSHDVYLWSVSNTAGSMQTIQSGDEYSEAYQINPDGGGISLKVGVDTECSTVTQFEYTLIDSSLWYDLSNINGYPFMSSGVTVVPTDTECRTVSCPAGTEVCGQAYNVPTDNFATAECGAGANLVVVLCSGEDSSSGSASSLSSVASVAVSTAQPVTVFSTSTTASTTVEAQLSSTVEPKYTSIVKSTVKSTVIKSASVAKSSSAAVYTHHTVVKQIIATTTAAPFESEAAANHNPYVVMQTTFVTHVVTVEARSPQATAAAEVKRDIHHHEHAAAHEHNEKRHQHPRSFPKK